MSHPMSNILGEHQCHLYLAKIEQDFDKLVVVRWIGWKNQLSVLGKSQIFDINKHKKHEKVYTDDIQLADSSQFLRTTISLFPPCFEIREHLLDQEFFILRQNLIDHTDNGPTVAEIFKQFLVFTKNKHKPFIDFCISLFNRHFKTSLLFPFEIPKILSARSAKKPVNLARINFLTRFLGYLPRYIAEDHEISEKIEICDVPMIETLVEYSTSYDEFLKFLKNGKFYVEVKKEDPNNHRLMGKVYYLKKPEIAEEPKYKRKQPNHLVKKL
jgi:hypothetical protein